MWSDTACCWERIMSHGSHRHVQIILMGLSMVGLLFPTHDAAGGLYQCRTEEGTIYTDTPAQLKQCASIGQSGGSSNLGLVGGQTTGSTTPPAAAPVPPQAQPVTPSTPDAPPAPTPSPSSSSSETATPTPCSVGINPLNPLSAPPCPTTEGPPSPPTNPPADANSPPPAPVQP